MAVLFAFPTRPMLLFACLPALLRTGLAASLLLTATQCQKSTAPAPAPNSSPPTSAAAFRHPGVVNSQESLAQAAAQADAAGYAKIVEYTDKYPAPTAFPPVVYAVASAGSPTEDQIRRDCILAYAYALRWAKTGDPAFAQKARQILNGYATTFQRYDTAPGPNGPTDQRQTYLEAAWVTPTFVAAAEILRYYKAGGTTGAGWPAAEVTQFSAFLTNLQTNYVDKVPGANNTVNNWQVSGGYAQLALGVWFDNREQYDKGRKYLLEVMPQVVYPEGDLKEQRDRDCTHPQYSLTALTYAAETARLQGSPELYEFSNQQIRVGWEKFEDAEAGNYPARNCGTTAVFPGIEVAANYYNVPKLTALRDRQAAYGVPSDRTFLGFTTFTHRGLGR